MMFDDGVYSVNSAIIYCNLLKLLLNDNGQTLIDGIVNANTGQLVNSTFRKGDASCPTFYYGESAGNQVLLINGVESLQAALNFYNGTVAGFTINPSNMVNAWAQAAAQVIQAQIATGHFQTPRNLYISGYSAGGPIGEYYAALIVNALGIQPVRISFGAAKAAGVNFYRPLATSNFALRWMNTDDPVPLLPPNQFPANSVYAAGCPVWMTRAGAFIHGSGGVEVDPNGNYSPAVIPSAASVNPSISIAAWLFGLDGAPSGPHSLNEYGTRLGLLAESFRPTVAKQVRESRPEQLDAPNRQEANIEAERAASVIFATGAAQNAQPVAIPAGQPFFAFRTGRVWYVGFGAATVAIGPTKKRARSMANAGNAMLRHLQLQGVVDPNAVLSQFSDYLAAAATPGGGFTPVMNTVNPAL